MSSIVSSEQDFIRELAKGYARKGYTVVPSREVRAQLGFEPDLVLRSNGQVTIVEVKPDAALADRLSIREMRERAREKGFRFELKVVPRTPKKTILENDVERVPLLLREARLLADRRQFQFAVLNAWIAIEVSVRAAKGGMKDEVTTNVGEIVGLADALDLVGEDGLLELRSVAELRNHVAHGFRVEIASAEANAAIALAERVASAAGLSKQKPGRARDSKKSKS